MMEQDMLHILGNEVTAEPMETGYLATHEEFENVHIRVEYKWGVKRFPPQTLAKRDNGILYGLVGADIVWPTCVECQIEEDDLGDVYLVNGVRGVQPPHNDGLFEQAPGPDGWPRPGIASHAKQGVPDPEPTTGRKIKDGNFEILDGWNVVEVIWQGDRAAHIVNGRLVNVVTDAATPTQAAPEIHPPDAGKDRHRDRVCGDLVSQNRGEVARVMVMQKYSAAMVTKEMFFPSVFSN